MNTIDQICRTIDDLKQAVIRQAEARKGSSDAHLQSLIDCYRRLDEARIALNDMPEAA